MGKKRVNQEGTYGKQNINGIDYYYYVFPINNNKRKKIYGRTQKELLDKIQAYKNDILASTVVNNPNMTFTELCYLFLSKGCFVSKRTLNHYYGILKNRIEGWKKYDLGNMSVDNITPNNVEEFLFSFKDIYAKRTIDRTYSVVEQALKYGIDIGLVNPAFRFDKINKPKENDVITKQRDNITLEKDEMACIANECLRVTADGKYTYGICSKIIYMLIFTGCRVTEMCSLKWKNVAKDFSYIDIKEVHNLVSDINEKGEKVGKSYYIDTAPKTKRSERRIPIPSNVRKILAEIKEEDLKNNDYKDISDWFVFKSPNKKFVNRDSVEKACKHIIKNCSLSKNIMPHTLRHAYGSILISEGVDIKVVSKLLGHTSVAFTYDTYINVLTSQEEQAMEVLDSIIDNNQIDSLLEGTVPLEALGEAQLRKLLLDYQRKERESIINKREYDNAEIKKRTDAYKQFISEVK